MSESSKTMSDSQSPKNYSSKKPWVIYRGLSENNKLQFWTVSISVFVFFLSLWIGISFQLIAIGENTTEQKKLDHVLVINKLIPYKDKFLSSSDSLLFELERLRELNVDSFLKVSIDLFEANPQRILTWADTCISISEEAKFYLTENECQEMTDNVFLTTIALPAFQEISDTANHVQYDYDFYQWRFHLANSNRISFEEGHQDQVTIAYLDSFRTAFFDYYKSRKSFSKYDVMLKANKALQEIGRINQEQIDSLTVLTNMLESESKQKLILLLYKYVVNSLTNNYYIINDNLQPYREYKVSIVPHNKNEWKYLWNSLKQIGISSEFKYIIFSLLIIIILGITLWYIILRIIFRKNYTNVAERPSNWTDTEEVKSKIHNIKEEIRKEMEVFYEKS